MKRLFISQPVEGIFLDKLFDMRNDISKEVSSFLHEEIVVIDNLKRDIPWSGVKFLGHSILAMSKSDVLYFADGWENDSKCRMEHAIAKEYGLKIIRD